MCVCVCVCVCECNLKVLPAVIWDIEEVGLCSLVPWYCHSMSLRHKSGGTLTSLTVPCLCPQFFGLVLNALCTPLLPSAKCVHIMVGFVKMAAKKQQKWKSRNEEIMV